VGLVSAPQEAKVVGWYDPQLVALDNAYRYHRLEVELAAVKAERRAWRNRAEQAECMLQIHGIAYAPPACAVDETGGRA
jgi:hypothetical protein